jgi:hypothetical protein
MCNNVLNYYLQNYLINNEDMEFTFDFNGVDTRIKYKCVFCGYKGLAKIYDLDKYNCTSCGCDYSLIKRQ